MGLRHQLAGLLTIISIVATAQHLVEPVQNERYYHLLHRLEVKQGLNKGVHTNMKTLSVLAVDSFDVSDETLSNVDQFNYAQHEGKYYYSFKADNSSIKDFPLINSLYRNRNDFYSYSKDGVYIGFNPVINFKGGIEKVNRVETMPLQGGNSGEYNKRLITNTRGAELKASIDDKIGVYTYITDNAINAPEYVDQRIMSNNVYPGETWVKGVKEGELTIEQIGEINTVEFFSARGYLTFNITKHVHAQFGHDKQFVGNGYRSLVMSHNPNSIFFLKLNTQFSKFNYQNIFYEVNNWPELDDNNMVQKKFGAYHQISMNITDFMNISIFENVVFSRGGADQARMELQYLNPVIFYKSVEHNMGSQAGSIDNNFLGIDGKLNFLKKFQVYGQLVLDDLSFQTLKPDVDSLMVQFGVKGERSYDTYASIHNKWAFQMGLKYIDVLGVNNLDLQFEHNRARPFTYAHFDQTNHYTHQGQSMAHPLGANFAENVIIGRFQPWPRLYLFGSIIQSKHGTDEDDTNWGSDLSKSTWYPGERYTDQQNGDFYNNEAQYNAIIGQGVLNQQIQLTGTASYALKNNFYIDGTLMYRNLDQNGIGNSHQTLMILVGIRLNAFNDDHSF